MTTKDKIEIMQAAVDGKPIEFRIRTGAWMDNLSPAWNWELCEYRIKPEPKLVPLTAKDVPPGSVIRFNQSTEWDADLPEEWTDIGMVSNRRGLGTITGDGRVVFVSWEEAMNHSIKRPGQDWTACHKLLD